MATKQEITQLVIEPLQLLAKPNVDPIASPMEYARMVNLYVETLEGFDETTIRRGMEMFVKNWQTKAWPVPGKLHQFFVEAETEQRETLPRAPLASLPERHIPPAERKRVGEMLGRMNALIRSGEYWQMSHEEAYDAVYGTAMHPDHKRDRLRNIARITENDGNQTTLER